MKVLKDLPGLQAHMLTHAGTVDRFQCRTYSKEYSTKKAMVYHEKSHNLKLLQDDMHNCPFHGCTKKFSSPQSKQEHVTYCQNNLDYKEPFNCLLMTSSSFFMVSSVTQTFSVKGFAFGHATASRDFTSLTKHILFLCRCKGFHAKIYLGDIPVLTHVHPIGLSWITH